MVYRFGVDARLVRENPALTVKAPMQRRSERMLPFESWAEVEAVAEECGRWAPMVVFLADTRARSGEAVAVEHRHLHPPTVELPGSKTEGA
jgi:integrase